MKNKFGKWLIVFALSLSLGGMMSLAEARCVWVSGNGYHGGHRVCSNNYNNGYHNGYNNGYRNGYRHCWWRNGMKYCN